MVRGTLDACTGQHAAGWAFDPAHPETRVRVLLRADGHPLGEVTADRFREDLRTAGIGDGNHAFTFPWPDAIRDGREHEVSAHAADGTPLSGSPQAARAIPRITRETFERAVPALDPPGGFDALRGWTELGYAVVPRAVPHDVIDAMLEDLERAWRDKPRFDLNVGTMGVTDIARFASREALPSTTYRYLDFHNVSEAAAEIVMNPRVLSLAAGILEAQPVAMQSLLFEYGTEQAGHMDFAYVHTGNPALLTAAWVACEDVDEGAGPLFYYPGSHRRVPKYDFGGGSLLAEGDGPHVRAFEAYLDETCRRLGLEKTVFLPRKGDVLLWHAALVHGGTARRDRGRTRKSLVTHYTARAVYPRDQRAPGEEPKVLSRNGGLYYAWAAPRHVEGRYSWPGRPRVRTSGA